MSRHENINVGTAQPVDTVALGSGSVSPSAPAALAATARNVRPENDPRMRAYVDG